jgi:hypothetical protein
VDMWRRACQRNRKIGACTLAVGQERFTCGAVEGQLADGDAHAVRSEVALFKKHHTVYIIN